MQSKEKTVGAYIKGLPLERKKAISSVRKIILKNLPKGYKETMQYGMPTYVIPLSIYPKGYLDKKDTPLPYVALASQKNFFAVYFMSIYADKKLNKWFMSEYKKTGKPIDSGKSCFRFKKLEDVPLELIGQAVRAISVLQMIELYEKGRRK